MRVWVSHTWGNKDLIWRILWPPSRTGQKALAWHRLHLNFAFHGDLLASRRHGKLYCGEVKWRTAQHRERSSKMVLLDTNLVYHFLFFAVPKMKPALQQIYTVACESSTQLLTDHQEKQVFTSLNARKWGVQFTKTITSIALLVPFVLHRSVEAGVGEETPSASKRERERHCCYGVELLFHKCFSKVMPCLINSKSSHSSTATQPAYSRCSQKPFHADL